MNLSRANLKYSISKFFNIGPLRILFWAFTFASLFIFLLQALNVIQFGTRLINLEWPIRMSLIFLATIGLDYIGKFKSNEFRFGYLFTFLFIATFGILNAYNLNEDYVVLNRIEHAAGSFLLITFMHGFFEEIDIYEGFKYRYLKYLFLTGMANIFVVLNEVVELFTQLITGTEVIKTPLDTPSDLAANFIGFFLFFILFYLVKKTKLLGKM